MGRKGFNWKSRQVVNTVIDNSGLKQIQLDLDVKGHYDASNELVLPSKKRKTTIKKDQKKIGRVLSKKQRKKLEKIVEKKKLKQDRGKLLEELAKVQVTPEELQKLTSIVTIQTKGVKKFVQEQANLPIKCKHKNAEICLNSIKGAKRQKLLQDYVSNSEIARNHDPNIVGFSESDNDGESDEDDIVIGEKEIKGDVAKEVLQAVDQKAITPKKKNVNLAKIEESIEMQEVKRNEMSIKNKVVEIKNDESRENFENVSDKKSTLKNIIQTEKNSKETLKKIKPKRTLKNENEESETEWEETTEILKVEKERTKRGRTINKLGESSKATETQKIKKNCAKSEITTKRKNIQIENKNISVSEDSDKKDLKPIFKKSEKMNLKTTSNNKKTTEEAVKTKKTRRVSIKSDVALKKKTIETEEDTNIEDTKTTPKKLKKTNSKGISKIVAETKRTSKEATELIRTSPKTEMSLNGTVTENDETEEETSPIDDANIKDTKTTPKKSKKTNPKKISKIVAKTKKTSEKATELQETEIDLKERVTENDETEGETSFIDDTNMTDTKTAPKKSKKTDLKGILANTKRTSKEATELIRTSPETEMNSKETVTESDETEEERSLKDTKTTSNRSKKTNPKKISKIVAKTKRTSEKATELQELIKTSSETEMGSTKTAIKTENDRSRIDGKELKSVVKTESNCKPAIYVDVMRTEEIERIRLKLPILGEEQQIMETINSNDITIISGETGSGKTTQIPQFLYEAGYTLNNKQIAVTEPRRVAAISMSQRVAYEMSLKNEIGYVIRFENNLTDLTKIIFMTDGVLLKEIQSDFLLKKYSVIILDEVHERTVYTDILIGLLSRIVPLRRKRSNPLKLIIMSATLKLDDFLNNRRLFKQTPPVIKIETRQFPVTIHFNRTTNIDYLAEAYSKIVKIHQNLPEGGVLVFVTGQQEVNYLVRKLRHTFPLSKNNVTKVRSKKKIKVVPEIDLNDYDIEDIEDLGCDSDLETDEVFVPLKNNQPLWVLPLYSLLPTSKQQEIFQAPPSGYRLCVIATNVAETSLTIPNIKYVVDCGKTKRKLYDKVTGLTQFSVMWTSKASAEQRAGRAGRLGPGHCYRLYSSAVFNNEFADYTEPEIKQKPIDDLYLQLKCMNINKIVNFPFPSTPDLLQLQTAEQRLEILGALKDGKVTDLGRVIVKYPVLPRFGKMLALSHQYDLINYTICLVAALSIPEVLLENPVDSGVVGVHQKWLAIRKRWAGIGNSLLLGDNMVLLKAVGASEYANLNNKLEMFCLKYGLRQKAIVEIRKLRMQLTNQIRIQVPDACVDPNLQPPSDLQAKLLRQILLAGLGDQIARRVDGKEFMYQANNMEQLVRLHSGSVLRKTRPEFVVYNEIYEIGDKIYMRGVTAIEPDWLVIYVPTLCNLSQPLTDPSPFYNNGKVFCTVNGTFGTQAWPLCNVQIQFPRISDCFKWFAVFFLKGEVCDKLAKYSEVLLSQPGIMVKSWGRLQPRTTAILQALIGRDCACLNDLLKIWEVDKSFLLKEYLMWVPESIKGEISVLWPPM